MLKIIKNNILTGLEDDKDFEVPTVILHGCNCFHTMGNGLSGFLSKRFPEIRNMDNRTKYADAQKLGTTPLYEISPTFVIVNCYTQYHISSHRDQVNYISLGKCLRNVNWLFPEHTLRISQIGCGSGGGNWEKVKKVIRRELNELRYVIFDDRGQSVEKL